MRHPKDMSREELVAALEGIRAVLYAGPQMYLGELDPNTDHPKEVVETWDPEREWESDELDDVAQVLRDYGLAPEGVGVRLVEGMEGLPAALPRPEIER